MIVTLTLNPSLDRTVEIPMLRRGEVIRAGSGRLEPGGKGVNVARALLANDTDAHAVLPVGGPVGHQLVELLEAEAVAMTAVPVAAATRSNLSLCEPDGTVTKVNEAGGTLTAEELDRLIDAVLVAASAGAWVVASGSLPPGTPADAYARLVTRLSGHAIRVAIDTSGPALRRAIAAGPALVKPNRDELADAVGRPVDTLADAVMAAEVLRDEGAGAVLVSLGADGAVLVDDDGVAHATSPVEAVRSSVGAGDCLLAGFLAAGAKGDAALAQAVDWAAAAVELPGSGVPNARQVAGRHAVVRREIDRRQLTG